MLKYQILKSDDPLWDKYLYDLPEKYHDVNFTAEYHSLMEKVYDADPELFVVTDNEKIFFHPYMIRRISKIGTVKIEIEAFDIQSAFGYTGPITNTDDVEFIQASNNLFEEICCRRNIIVEFIRFNPLLENHTLTNILPDIQVTNLKEFVVLDLTQSLETINQNYKHSLRTNLRVAQEYPDWDWVVSNQKDVTMDVGMLVQKRLGEKNVEQLYYLRLDYYEKLSDFVLTNGSIFSAFDKKTNKKIAGEVFLFGKDTVYFLHSARDVEDLRSSNINTFLINQAILHFKEAGFKWFFMGGGVSNSLDDSLLKFKKKFSQNIRNFFIGKRVFNNDIYNYLCQTWENEFPHLKENRKNIVLKYLSIINIMMLRFGAFKLAVYFLSHKII